jgi:predicted nuclease of predicted toxin-antitoxin system
VRLLLDEQYSHLLAERLRAAGHDVVSVQERDDLLGASDRELLRRAAAEGRALLTEDVSDFLPLVREAAAFGDRHMGVLITTEKSLPRRMGAIGVFIGRLDSFLREHPDDDALADQVHWLSAD